MKNIKNTLQGFHLNSKHWQNWKRQRPNLNPSLFQLVLGITLSDATMYRVSRDAHIKFEQGHLQKEFLFHLFQQIDGYTFMENPGIRKNKDGTVKSFWFKTFSHPTFSTVYDLFYKDNKKSITNSIILTHLEKEGLAYWIMGDGSLHRDKRVLTLHTQGFSHEENLLLSTELNEKFNFSSKVVKHKASHVVQFTTQDANKINDMVSSTVIDSMKYKVPRKILHS